MSAKPSFTQAQQFFRYLAGYKEIGASHAEAVAVPYCPEMMAFLEGILPEGPYWWHAPMGMHAVKQHAMVDMIRALCDAFEAGPTK